MFHISITPSTMIAASPFSCDNRNTRNAHHPHSTRNESPEGFLAGRVQSLRTRSYPESKVKLSSGKNHPSLLFKETKERGVTKIGLRNPPHLIYQALQEHKLKIMNNEHFHPIRQQLQSIEQEIKKLLADERQVRRRNSISRSTNIAREIETIDNMEHEIMPKRKRNHHRRKVHKHTASFPVPLSIPEGEEEHLWSSCPSLVYEPEPRDLPPKLPTRRWLFSSFSCTLRFVLHSV